MQASQKRLYVLLIEDQIAVSNLKKKHIFAKSLGPTPTSELPTSTGTK